MKAISAVFLVMLATFAFGQKTWTGDISTNWSNALNWSPNSVPIAGDRVIFPDFAPNCIVDVVPATISGITMASGYASNLDLNGNTLNIADGFANDFLGGTVSGVSGGAISITGERAATFNGTDFGANVTVTVSLTNAILGSNGVFTGGTGTTFGGTVNITAPSILLNGSTYNSTATFNKTGASAVSSLGNGGNTFHGTTTIINSMNHIFRTANLAGTTDTFNGLLTLSLNGSNTGNILQLAFLAGTQTNFNNHVRIRSNNFAAMSSVSGGIVVNAILSIGGNANAFGGGTSTLASGFTIDEVDPAVSSNNFQKGDFIIKNLTQLGNTAQSLDIRNSAGFPSANNLRVFIINSVYNGTVTYSFSNSFVSFSTFNNVTTFNKTTGGGGDDTFPPPAVQNSWDGGNIFLTTVNFNHYNTSTWVMARLAGDVFHGDVNLYSDLANTATLGSYFRLADVGTSDFKQNVNISTKVGLTNEINVQFARGGGTARFNGTTTQSINYGGTINGLAIKFGTIHMNNSNGLNLNFPATVLTNANLQSGIIQLASADTLTFATGAATSNASNASFVDGQVIKRGTTAFVFPVGDGGSYHPIGISAPATNTSFIARYFKADHGLGSAANGGLVKVSDCEYWTLNRQSGVENVSATLYWNDASYCHGSYITDATQLRAARWSGTLWNNLGAINQVYIPSVDGTEGNLTTAAALPDAASHTLTFGSLIEGNVLPISLAAFQVLQRGTSVDIVWQTLSERNNDFFTIERFHKDGFVAIAQIDGAGTSSFPIEYQWTDISPLPALSYYRLKQTDFNGAETYSGAIALHRHLDETPYPNPVKNTLYLDGVNFDEDSQLILTDVTGRVIYSGGPTQSLDFQGLSSGIYRLGIKNKGGVRWFPVRKE